LNQKIKFGLKSISERKIIEARDIYKNVQEIYNPREDTKQEIRKKAMELYNQIINTYNQIFKNNLLIFIGFIGLLFLFLLNPNITGRFIEDNLSYNWKKGLILLIIIFIALLILLRKKITKFLSNIKMIKKYSSKNVSGLINKRIYSEDGKYVGKIKEIILRKNKIEKLKIKLNKKQKTKGIIIKWNCVVSCGEIVIINKSIIKKIDSYKN
jgi:sporulation protein YlmC with PRC-barrel domain